MYEMEFHFRSHYYDYCKGIYNSAELLFMTVHIMKGFELYDLDVKSLVELVRDAVKKSILEKGHLFI